MQLEHSQGSTCHLTYCSNIHAGESLPQVMENLRRHIPAVRQALNVSDDMGIGLRLSAAAAGDLAQPGRVDEMLQLLAELRCYIFTLNGFPYGPFHGTRVKEDVYLPDWKDPERLRYTNQLADLLATLLKPQLSGSISTVPGAFKARVQSEDDVREMTSHYVSHCAHLVRLEQQTGRSINLALEPEPCCFLETIEEAVDYFSRELYGSHSVLQLQNELGIDASSAETLLRKHLTLCLDLCHAAVEFEQASECFTMLQDANIAIGKLQISAGLRLSNVTTARAELLKPFVDDVYLHQVVERHGDQINRYADLPQAFEQLVDDEIDREWRVHFHVPVFLDTLGDFGSTQFFIKEALALHKQSPISSHLEVETYTWDVLPDKYKNQSIDDAIARELNWVKNEL